MKTEQTPLERLRYHVTGAIERGEATPIIAQSKGESAHTPAGKSLNWFPVAREGERLYQAIGSLAMERDRLREQRDELLAACKRVLDVITGDQAAGLGIYAAIAKAEGEKQ